MPKSDLQNPYPPHIVLSDVLSHVGSELRLLSGSIVSIEYAIERLSRAAASFDGQTIKDIQSLDLLNQTVIGLAQFLENLALSMPRSWRANARLAASSVSLADLASRLEHAAGRHPDGAKTGDAEFMDLF